MLNTTRYPLALKGLKVLHHIVQADAPMSAKELCQAMDIPKPTMYRILALLEEQQYISRYQKRYQILPPLFFDLSSTTLAHWHIQSTRNVLLTQLSERVKETCNLSTVVKNEIVYIDRVEANRPVKVQLTIGSKLPMHCTATGKLFLAYMKPSQRKETIKNLSLEKISNNTITHPDTLFESCRNARKKKYSIADEELSVGSIAIATPIFSANKKMSMAVSIQAPKFRTSVEQLCAFLPELQDTAGKLQKLYQPLI